MIKYALKCPDGHQFESWFQSASAYDALSAAGHVTCAICGDTKVEKALMAPNVASDSESPKLDTTPDPEAPLAKLKEHIETNSTYVGKDFAQQARDIHDGSAPDRMIHGEANAQEARKLVEDGVPVLPLPFLPTRKVN